MKRKNTISLNAFYLSFLLTSSMASDLPQSIEESYKKSMNKEDKRINNSGLALFQLGKDLCDKAIYSLGIQYLEKARLTYNLPEAYSYLSQLYLEGKGVEKDQIKGNQYIHKAADLGHLDSQIYLGHLYAKDLTKSKISAHYFQMAADNGHMTSQIITADNYKNGCGVEKSLELYIQYLMMAANQDNIKALILMGSELISGQQIQVDYQNAYDYFSRAATLGSPDGNYYTAYLLENGLGTEKDLRMAFGLYHFAADRGHSMAQLKTAEFYENGLACDINIETAITYYKRSVDQGNTAAACQLGVLYEMTGSHQNYELAFNYYSIAAKQNLPKALCSLGRLYLEGKGVKQDYKLSRDYYEASIADIINGNRTGEESERLFFANVMNQLSNFYLNGWGIEKNIKTAENFINLAQKNLEMVERARSYKNPTLVEPITSLPKEEKEEPVNQPKKLKAPKKTESDSQKSQKKKNKTKQNPIKNKNVQLEKSEASEPVSTTSFKLLSPGMVWVPGEPLDIKIKPQSTVVKKPELPPVEHKNDKNKKVKQWDLPAKSLTPPSFEVILPESDFKPKSFREAVTGIPESMPQMEKPIEDAPIKVDIPQIIQESKIISPLQKGDLKSTAREFVPPKEHGAKNPIRSSFIPETNSEDPSKPLSRSLCLCDNGLGAIWTTLLVGPKILP